MTYLILISVFCCGVIVASIFRLIFSYHKDTSAITKLLAGNYITHNGDKYFLVKESLIFKRARKKLNNASV